MFNSLIRALVSTATCLTASCVTLSLVLTATITLSACGGSLPGRFVVERDVEEYQYRRYQRVLDIEFPVEGNEAVGHTATYVLRDRARSIRYANVFVSVYDESRGLAAEVKRSLDSLGTYDVSVEELSGEYVFFLDGGGDSWVLWISGNHVVKLGGPNDEDVPESLSDLYLGIYPSDLDEHGRAREGTASAGRAHDIGEEDDDDGLGIPAHLREGAPQ